MEIKEIYVESVCGITDKHQLLTYIINNLKVDIRNIHNLYGITFVEFCDSCLYMEISNNIKITILKYITETFDNYVFDMQDPKFDVDEMISFIRSKLGGTSV